MKYEEQILGAFKRVGYVPRAHQMEAVDHILQAYVDHEKMTVILSAPTGSGKSIIGLVVAEVLTDIKHDPKLQTKKMLKGLFLTATNALSHQYRDSFQGKFDFMATSGASTYKCAQLYDNDPTSTAEDCMKKVLKPNDICGVCEYNLMKSRRNNVEHLVTNYALFMIDRLFAKILQRRILTIWDEAHLVNDLFSDQSAISFDAKRLDSIAKDCKQRLTPTEEAKVLPLLNKAREGLGRMDDSNYLEILGDYRKLNLTALILFKEYVKEVYDEDEDKYSNRKVDLPPEDLKQYQVYSKLVKRYEGVESKIADFDLPEKYEHVFDNKDGVFSIKPVFIGKTTPRLTNNSDYHLFMSGTISMSYVETVFNMKPEDVEFILLPPVFDPANKLVSFYNNLTLNYDTLKNPAMVETLINDILAILKMHQDLGESGIIQTPSFYLQQQLVNGMRGKLKHRLFNHEQGTKLGDTLTQFKASKVPSLLISPSIYEGIDLPDDISRFQILVKAPFPSLGDKRIAYILKHHKDFYSEMTIMKIVQGAGRSVRNEDDYSVTYFLDASQKRLFFSKQNVWQGEFQVLE